MVDKLPSPKMPRALGRAYAWGRGSLLNYAVGGVGEFLQRLCDHR